MLLKLLLMDTILIIRINLNLDTRSRFGLGCVCESAVSSGRKANTSNISRRIVRIPSLAGTTNRINCCLVTEAEQNRIFENWLTLHKGLIFKVVRVYARTAMDQDDLFQENRLDTEE